MGTVLSAQCPCGLEAQVFAGSGMTQGSACLPAWCQACQRLVTAPTQRGAPHCETCKAPVDVIRLYEPTGLKEHLPEMPVRCPRCGAPSLRFEFAGIWD